MITPFYCAVTLRMESADFLSVKSYCQREGIQVLIVKLEPTIGEERLQKPVPVEHMVDKGFCYRLG